LSRAVVFREHLLWWLTGIFVEHCCQLELVEHIPRVPWCSASSTLERSARSSMRSSFDRRVWRRRGCDNGLATKRQYLWPLWIVSLDLKHTEASFSPRSLDSLCFRVAQVPRSWNVVPSLLAIDSCFSLNRASLVPPWQELPQSQSQLDGLFESI
jgi:hypothetical protein